MKFIFSFLLTFAFLLPAYADYNTGTPEATCTQYSNPNSANNTDQTSCIATPGCEWDTELACFQCQSGTASAAGANSCTPCSDNPSYQSIVVDPTKQHPDGASSCDDWVCTEGYTQIDNSCLQCTTTKPAHSHYVTDCNNWECDANYYAIDTDDDNTFDQCQQCPQNSEIGIGATSVNQCSCPSGYVKLLDRDGNWIYNATTGCVSTLTQSNSSAWVQNGNDYICPEHATLNITGTTPTCSCPSGSSFNSNENDCKCNDTNQHFTGTTDNYSCSSCPNNSTLSDGTCKCNAGYYGTGGNCSQCPYGTTTTTTGATQKSDCIMTHDTQFCDANGENCMNLIP